jgi:hypothetical protein
VRLSRDVVSRATDETADQWSVSNRILYDVCRKHPRHVDAREITAKVLLVGRVYAASIERGRANASSISGDQFYGEVVPRKLMRSKLDDRLEGLRPFRTINETAIEPVLETHYYLMGLFRELTGKEKRSLASKYLHFHLPALFFLYDSRAAEAMRLLLEGWRPRSNGNVACDSTYARFFHSALELRRRLEDRFQERLSPRHLDRILLATHARHG